MLLSLLLWSHVNVNESSRDIPLVSLKFSGWYFKLQLNSLTQPPAWHQSFNNFIAGKGLSALLCWLKEQIKYASPRSPAKFKAQICEHFRSTHVPTEVEAQLGEVTPRITCPGRGSCQACAFSFHFADSQLERCARAVAAWVVIYGYAFGLLIIFEAVRSSNRSNHVASQKEAHFPLSLSLPFRFWFLCLPKQ